MLAGDEASGMTGVAAAIALGKYAVIHIYVSKASQQIRSEYKVTDDIAMVAIAD